MAVLDCGPCPMLGGGHHPRRDARHTLHRLADGDVAVTKGEDAFDISPFTPCIREDR